MDVPSSLLEKGTILIEVEYSFISSGTEIATLEALGIKNSSENSGEVSSRLSNSYEMANKIAKYLKNQGIKKTVERVFEKISKADLQENYLIPLGYSCSGRIVSIGKGVNGFSIWGCCDTPRSR